MKNLNIGKHRLCLLYGYDTELYGNETESDTLQCGKGTKEECELALRHVMRAGIGNKITIALGAGRDPHFPHYPELKHLMRDYLKSSLLNAGYALETPNEETIVFTKEGYEEIIIRCSRGDEWGIFMQTMDMVNTVDSIHFDDVVVISHKVHIPSIEQSLSFLDKFQNVMTLSCPGNPTDWELFFELFEIAKVWMLGTFYLKKLNHKTFA